MSQLHLTETRPMEILSTAVGLFQNGEPNITLTVRFLEEGYGPVNLVIPYANGMRSLADTPQAMQSCNEAVQEAKDENPSDGG